jgi:hypothetical protein
LIADYAGGRGVFTQTDVVRTEGQTFGSEAIRFLIGLAINDSGVIAALLGQSDAIFELELDGPTGSTLDLDNVYLPGLVNGTF